MSNGSIAAIDHSDELIPCAAVRLRHGDGAERMQFGAEGRMRVEQEAGREFGAVQPAGGLTEAGGCEVEEREALEEEDVAHRRIERGDQLLRGIELGQRDLFVATQRFVTLGAR